MDKFSTLHRLRQRYGTCKACQTISDQATVGKSASKFTAIIISVAIVVVNRERSLIDTDQ